MKIIDRLCAARSLRHRIAASRGRLFRVALAWSGNAMVADDLVQETLESALNNVQQLRDPERLYAWMYSIMINCWRHYLRRQRPECELDEMQFTSDSDPELLSDQHAAVAQVRAAIARLPVGQREVLTLVDLEGFAYQEVADILEIPIGTVMSRLSRARGFLQTALHSLRQEPDTAAARLRRVQ